MTFRAAEIHYFRVPRDLWELMLLRARQFGADTISTYIPWGFHEMEEGRVDLTGETVLHAAEVGDTRTDLLVAGEPPAEDLGAFDTFRRLMASRVGGDTDWKELQRAFALARVRGDLAASAGLERRLRLLAAAELTVAHRDRAKGDA